MSALTDPVAALRRAQEQSCHCGCLDGGPSTESMGGGAALEELERRARIEARRDVLLQNFGAFEIRHWDDTEGWAVLIWDPDTADGEPPPPSFDDFSDREHDQDYWKALEAALNAVGAPSVGS